jgi:uncharacterized membrane protein YeaQ/YmgE (transglycosylase-associated protein family)
LHILWTILIGFFVGLVARAIHPGADKMGFILTTALGIAGALVASFAGQALGLYAPGQPTGFIGASVGAIVLLAVVKLVRRR